MGAKLLRRTEQRRVCADASEDPRSLTEETTEEAQTCATGLEPAALSVQQQREDQDEDEDEPHQGHDQQEPPLLVEGTFRQSCRHKVSTLSGSDHLFTRPHHIFRPCVFTISLAKHI